MTSGKLNFCIGSVVLIVAAFGGFGLGLTLDPFFEKGFAAYPLTRFLLRSGHTHGMLIALINIVVGLSLSRLSLSERGKKACSILTAAALLLPVGLALRGLTNGAMTFAPVVMLGGMSLAAASVLLTAGGLRGFDPSK